MKNDFTEAPKKKTGTPKELGIKEESTKEGFIHSINWYPGHIAKAEKQLKEKISMIDFVIEVRDARIPFASHHKDLKEWLSGKPYITLLNKSDLADAVKCKIAKNIIEAEKEAKAVYLVNSRASSLPLALIKSIDELGEAATRKFKAKGILKRAARIMIVGYPNVGKSTLINKLSKTRKAKVENRPGVTQRQQWIQVKTQQEILLLDTPGIIPTKLYSDDQGVKLALCNCVSGKAFDPVELLVHAIPLIESLYPNAINNYYGVENYKSLLDEAAVKKIQTSNNLNANNELNETLINKFLEIVAIKKGWLQKDTDADMERTALKIINDFREQKFALMNLE
jgi:ribosome biogenesis GTPase A